ISSPPCPNLAVPDATCAAGSRMAVSAKPLTPVAKPPSPADQRDFKAALKFGSAMEAVLDAYFEESFDIEVFQPSAEVHWAEDQSVGKWLQVNGVDRAFTYKDTGARITIEYKADRQAAIYGNYFIGIERVKNGVSKADWGLTSLAQRIVFFSPQLNTA